MIECVAIIIKDGDKILVAKRTDSNEWASPGGLIKTGETPRQAVIRETQEEMGTSIINPHMIYQIDFETPEGELGHDYLFVADDYSTEPKADGKEMKNAMWVTREELNHMKLYKPFQEFLEMYDKLERRK